MPPKSTAKPTEPDELDEAPDVDVSLVPDWVMQGGADAKLTWVQAHIGQVKKTGRNTHQKFDYFQEHGIFAQLRPYQRALRFSVRCSAIDLERDGNTRFAVFRVTMTDVDQPPLTDDGSPNELRQVVDEFPMEATDNLGWGTAKLLTYGHKFALQKFFHLPTDQLPEAETEGIESTASQTTKAAGKGKLTEHQVLQLRKALKAATPEDAGKAKAFTDRVAMKLKADFGVDTTSELTQGQLPDFQAWVLEATQKAA